MVGSIKKVGPNRYRETFGRYYEDFKQGDIYEHRPGKTVTEYDNHMFTLMTMNTHPMHSMMSSPRRPSSVSVWLYRLILWRY